MRFDVGNDEANSRRDLRIRFLDQLVDGAFFDVEGKILIGEFAGGIVVGNAKLGARDAIVGGCDIEQRDRLVFVAGLFEKQHGDGQDILGRSRFWCRLFRSLRGWRSWWIIG